MSAGKPELGCLSISQKVVYPRVRRGRLFGNVFSRLDPDRFQECFMEWSQGVADLLPGEVMAIDGKPVLRKSEGTVRCSHDQRAGKEAIHLVSAWASTNTPVSSTG